MTPLEKYMHEIVTRVSGYRANDELRISAQEFFNQIGIGRANYVYNFTWLGVPIIQLPQDLQAMQEIIWQAKPDLIIETGVAWGGSLIFSASMQAILESCGKIENGRVVGIDIEVRPHNKKSIAAHPLSGKITLVEGSSVAEDIIGKVWNIAREHKRIMVFLDSNHTHEHVLAELEAYAPLVSPGSYCMVGDTVIEDAPESMSSSRPWGKGNNPKTAVWEFLRRLSDQGRTCLHGRSLKFEVDHYVEDKIVVTGSPGGYLKRI